MTAAFRLFIGVILAIAVSALFPAEVHAQRVALLHAGAVHGEDVKAKLVSAGLDAANIDVFDVGAGTAVADYAALVQPYDVIFTWVDGEGSYADPVALGNALADHVDAGGGVVQAAFSFSVDVPLRLDGRWHAEFYAPFTRDNRRMAFGMSLVPVLADHPILANVTSFNGGPLSFYHSVVAQGACAKVVANWSNNRPLVAARRGPRGGRIVGLNFIPVSSSAEEPPLPLWDAATDGHILMANAVRFAAAAPAPAASNAPAVAIVAADSQAMIADVQCKLYEQERFSRVDVIEVSQGMAMPSLAALQQYSAVLTWAGNAYGDPSALGDALAAFVDDNRGVVSSPVTFDPSGGQLAGAWAVAPSYKPFVEAPIGGGANMTLTPVVPHILLSGVASFNGGSSSYHATPVMLDAANVPVANWTEDAQSLVAYGRRASGGRLVGLNMYPPSSDVSDSWDARTDGARLIANSLLFAANHFPTVTVTGAREVQATAAGATFTLNAVGSDLDGDALSYAWSGAVPPTSGQGISFDVPPPSTPTQTYSVSVIVRDGKGGETAEIVTLTVRAPEPDETSLPGRVTGYGLVRSDGVLHGFAFAARERASGAERGALALSIKRDHRHRGQRDDEFVAKTVDAVTFAPGSIVTFSGTGRFNGKTGYRYEVAASEKTRTRRDDRVRITITGPGGTVVAQVDGTIAHGNITFHRDR